MPRATQGGDSTVRSEARQLSGSGRVLFVEDNAEVRKSLADLLEVLGFEVDIATDGYEALARARAARPDAILCGVGLPNGMEVTEVENPLVVSVHGALARGIGLANQASGRSANFSFSKSPSIRNGFAVNGR
jgi:hypothetical protein